MTKKGIANKAAIQSARAKLNKALVAAEGVFTKTQIASIDSVIGWCNTQLAAKVTTLPEGAVAEAAAELTAEDSVCFEDAVAAEAEAATA